MQVRFAIAVSLLCCPSVLFATDTTPANTVDLQVQADKAQHAHLRDQCYLYAQLVRSATELANRELAAGNSEASALALRSVENYAGALDAAVASDAKKLKDAEILLRESAFRLKAAMLAASINDRPAMAAVLSKVNATEAKIMGVVFAH